MGLFLAFGKSRSHPRNDALENMMTIDGASAHDASDVAGHGKADRFQQAFETAPVPLSASPQRVHRVVC